MKNNIVNTQYEKYLNYVNEYHNAIANNEDENLAFGQYIGEGINEIIGEIGNNEEFNKLFNVNSFEAVSQIVGSDELAKEYYYDDVMKVIHDLNFILKDK